MCILALLYRAARGTPILVAANREERFDRPTQYPKIQSGSPRVVCGMDRQGGGTWLGVNQYGLFCAVTNRRKLRVPLDPRSRGLLCRELLDLRNAKDAAAYAAKELATGAYAGANYVCADARYAAVVHGANKVEVVELEPGLHVISGGDVNDGKDPRDDFVRRMLDLHTLDSAVTFLAVASRVFSRKPDKAGRHGIVLTGNEFGTVSSSLISLPRKIQQAVYQYAPGSPCDCAYDDLSALLRQVLSTERSRKSHEANGNGKASAAAPNGVKEKEGEKEADKSKIKAKVAVLETSKKKK
jgi:hypothetical protein